MKKQISRVLLSFTVLFTLAVVASAQTTRGIKIEVPFGFDAGQKHLAAGRYTVRRVKFDSESVLLIQSEDKRDAAIVLTNSGGRAPSDASLSFRLYGDRYFLTSVSMPGTASVRAVPKTGGERRIAHTLIEQAKAGGEKAGDDAPRTVTINGSVQ
jgi:hypothetical protein